MDTRAGETHKDAEFGRGLVYTVLAYIAGGMMAWVKERVNAHPLWTRRIAIDALVVIVRFLYFQ